jgi:RNA polymerase sigma-70 factor, ECF subfamily
MEGLCSGRADAWRRLHDVYAPVIACWCRRRGLRPDDADDVVQDVFATPGLLDFHRDGGSDSFVSWLFTITRSRLLDRQRRQGHAEAAGGSDHQQQMEALAAPASDEDSGEFEQLALRRALDMVQAKVDTRTWTAFWRAVVDGQDVARVAAELGMPPGAVRVAKSRVLQQLRDEMD